MNDSKADIRRQEKIANIAFAVSFFSWAILGLTLPADAGSIIRWCIAALHLIAGLLILIRHPVRLPGSNQDLVLCVPSVISAGLVFNFAAATDTWHFAPTSLFIASTAWTIISLVALGKNFAIFPAVRSVVSFGPYRLVRHPAYLGELGLVVACVFASNWTDRGVFVLIAFIFAMATIIVRISVEERLLGEITSYREYAENVKWKLIPGAW